MSFLSRIEEILLLAIWKLKDNAFGVTIIEQVELDTGVSWMSGSIYGALTRLKKNGYITTARIQSSRDQAGRPRIYYQITDLGMDRLIDLQKVNQAVWDGVPDLKKAGNP